MILQTTPDIEITPDQQTRLDERRVFVFESFSTSAFTTLLIPIES
jgi:hypothetical protein